ncbi:MAG: phasin family protein [Sphingorhabdus sp.]|uniref:phasin family protein n=1 Tax=Sphingorhabdus sp. TaxID=1902408 RepID=UPI003BAE3EDE|nr:phasin family protein [Sphingomonadales bacterium]
MASKVDPVKAATENAAEVVATVVQESEKMTETAKKTAKAAEAKATDFFADLREKATEATEKAKKLAADAGEINKANLEALVEAGKIAAKGAQELGKTNVEYAKKNFEEFQVAVKEVTAVKSANDFVKVQGEWARKGVDTFVAQSSKNTEALVKLANDMFQPISNRMAETAEYFKKAA